MAIITLALLAHQDDEFCAFPLLAAAIGRGERVLAVYTTRHRNDAVEAAREAESIEVLGTMGVARSDIVFLGASGGIFDGESHCHFARLLDHAAAYFESLAERPSQLLVPAWEGGHMDHDCAHAAALILQPRLYPNAEVWQFPLYTSGRILPFRVMVPRPENGSGTMQRFSLRNGWQWFRLLARYRSQRRSFVGIAPEAAIHYLLARRVVRQPTDMARIAQRPHAGSLFYERRYGIAYADVAAAIAANLTRPHNELPAHDSHAKAPD